MTDDLDPAADTCFCHVADGDYGHPECPVHGDRGEGAVSARAPWRCRHGWHRWSFVGMDQVRLISIPGHSTWLCRLTERCHRCGLHRTVNGANIPKRPRVEVSR